jgi:hypothetical protein
MVSTLLALSHDVPPNSFMFPFISSVSHGICYYESSIAINNSERGVQHER